MERCDRQEIYGRDGWICQPCDLTVSRDLIWPDPLFAGLDHVISLIAGGAHSKANTQPIGTSR